MKFLTHLLNDDDTGCYLAWDLCTIANGEGHRHVGLIPGMLVRQLSPVAFAYRRKVESSSPHGRGPRARIMWNT